MSLTAAIHIAKAQLGMDDETYRAFLANLTGKDSCAKLTTREKGRVLDEMKRCGFQYSKGKDARRGKPLVRDPQARKIRALWLAMADAGIVRDRSEKALAAYMRRITGRTLVDASVKQCQAVIETLKAWFDRCDDADARARCMAILQADDTASTMVDGCAVVRPPAAFQ